MQRLQSYQTTLPPKLLGACTPPSLRASGLKEDTGRLQAPRMAAPVAVKKHPVTVQEVPHGRRTASSPFRHQSPRSQNRKRSSTRTRASASGMATLLA